MVSMVPVFTTRRDLAFHSVHREFGSKPSLSNEDAFMSRIYSNVVPVGSDSDHKGNRGAVFNLEFSKDGKLLVAACEKRCIVSFSALSRKNVFTVEDAHQGYVNCVKFLDSRMLASCSDDNMVAVWDVRNLRQKVHCLEAHSNWVKNIEYLPHRSLLVTSGFDGSIYTWDLNKIGSTAERMQSTRVLHTNGLMRTSLSPDFSKLVVCNNNGYIMVVHDVDFDTMQEDLRGFKPSLYKLMQISKTPFPAAARYTHLFDESRTRNRIEFITDFPPENIADMITSLAMHPMGWCVASRNTSGEDASEWTCVHDIQDGRRKPPSDDQISPPPSPPPWRVEAPPSLAPTAPSGLLPSDSVRELQSLASAVGSIFTIHLNENGVEAAGDQQAASSDDAARRPRPVMQIRFNASLRGTATDATGAAAPGGEGLLQALSGRSIELRAPSADVVEALEIIREHRRRQRAVELGRSPDDLPEPSAQGPFIVRTGPSRGGDSVFLIGSQERARERYRHVDFSHRIAQNADRLTHYIEEPHPRLTLGFIKELCFSADGRVLCSPFGHGVRLLGFSESSQELSSCVSEQPRRLCELATTVAHQRAVVTAKFSPTECLLATGCLGGQVAWHQPRL